LGGWRLGEGGGRLRVPGVVPGGDRRTIRQRRSAQPAADVTDVDDVMGNPETRGARAREFEFLSVTLPIIERNETNQAPFDRDLVRQGDGIESAGADDERVHGRLLVLTG